MAKFRRLSEKQTLVTLGEINVTPLIDLAFVLLIIFVITTQTIEYSLELKLPKGGDPPPESTDRVVKVVDIPSNGTYELEEEPIDFDALCETLLAERDATTNQFVVAIRGDEASPLGSFALLFDFCMQNQLTPQIRFDQEEE